MKERGRNIERQKSREDGRRALKDFGIKRRVGVLWHGVVIGHAPDACG